MIILKTSEGYGLFPEGGTDAIDVGDEVFWTDPDGGECSRFYRIGSLKVREDFVILSDVDGSDLECFPGELN